MRPVGLKLPPLALAYHGLAAVPLRHDPHRLFTNPAALGRQVRRLRSFGYRLVTAGELARRVAAGDGHGYAALTFDDGFADELDVLPERLGAPATLFPVSGWLGGRHPDPPYARIATPARLRALHAMGIEIGAHTVTHPDLTALSFEDCLDELVTCRRDLEAILDAPVESLAYPYGAADRKVLAASGAAGYRWAWRAAGLGSWTDPRALPRQDMLNACTTFGLRLKRTGRYEEVVRHPLIRAARRARLRARGHRRPDPPTTREPLPGPREPTRS